MTDAFPRYMSGFLTLSAANAFTTTTENLPVNRGGFVTGVAMEFLWMIVEVTATDILVQNDDVRFMVSVGTTPTVMARIDNPDVLGHVTLRAQSSTAVGFQILDFKERIDWQTTDGRGQLVASDQIHISGDSTTQAAAVTFPWRIYYRFVKIGDRALFGLIQSQS